MHVMRIIGWTLLGIWGYCFVGLYLGRGILIEHHGMRDKLFVFVIMLIWPILPFIEAFE